MLIALADWPLRAEPTRRERCIDLIDNGTAAIVAEDWPKLEELSNQLVAECRSLLDAESISVLFEFEAKAGNQMMKFDRALEASEACIKTYYANPGCHCEEARALMGLERPSEALAAINRARKIAVQGIEDESREIKQAIYDSERAQHRSRKAKYEAIVEVVDDLKDHMAPTTSSASTGR